METSTMKKQSKKLEPLKWKTEKRKVKDLIPFEGNPRKITKKQTEILKKSLEKFNLVEIPAINLDNKIIAGHQRLKILILLGRGDEEIDVRVPNRMLTEEELKEYNLRSNKNTAEWDYDLLATYDEDMLIEAGFEELDIENVLKVHDYSEKKIELKDLKMKNKCPKCGYEW